MINITSSWIVTLERVKKKGNFILVVNYAPMTSIFSWRRRGLRQGHEKYRYQRALGLAGVLSLQQFITSSRWVSAWKKCCNVGYRRSTNTAQKIPAYLNEQLTHFHRSIVRYWVFHEYHLCEITNRSNNVPASAL